MYIRNYRSILQQISTLYWVHKDLTVCLINFLCGLIFRVVTEPTGSKLESSCMYPNMKVYYKNPQGQFDELTAVPTQNVTIKCQYYIQQ